MINSPTLSVLSSSQKTIKTPVAPASTDAQQSFGSAFDAANQSVQKNAPAERETIEKTQSNQDSVSSSVDQKSGSTEANRSEQGQQSSRHGETTKQSVSGPSAESVSETDSDSDVTTDKTASSLTEEEGTQGQENGKAWQAEGQSLAVDPEIVTAFSSDSQVIAQASPDEALESPLESALIDEADAPAVEESIEASTDPLLTTESDNASASSTATGVTDTIMSGDLEVDDTISIAGDADLGGPTAAESAAEASVTNKPADDIDSSTEVLENISVSLNDVNDSSNTAPLNTNESVETNAERAAIAQSGLDATQRVSEQAAEVLQVGADVAQLRESRSVDLVAQDVVEQADVDNTDSKASDNLRWVMEQMSKKTAEPVGLNNALNQVPQDSASFAESDFLGSFTDGELVLDSEKIELPKDVSEMLGGKKTLDQLMANLGSQLQPAAAQTNTQGALNALQNNPASARPESAAAQLTMQSLPNATAFPSEMAAKVSWVAREGFKTAHIQLDPPELGSLTVKISVDHESNTHVSFVASSAQAKDALEGQMQRLREMLQQQGVELDSVDVEVSQGNEQGFGAGQFTDDAGQGGSASGVANGDDILDGDELENMSYVEPAKQGIDYYA